MAGGFFGLDDYCYFQDLPDLFPPMIFIGIGVGLVSIALTLCCCGSQTTRSRSLDRYLVSCANLRWTNWPHLRGSYCTQHTLRNGGADIPITEMNATKLQALGDGYLVTLLVCLGFALLMGPLR